MNVLFNPISLSLDLHYHSFRTQISIQTVYILSGEARPLEAACLMENTEASIRTDTRRPVEVFQKGTPNL